MKNKPIPYIKTVLGIVLLILSINTHAGTQAIPDYAKGIKYKAGDNVQNNGKIYQCKPWPYSGWCQQSAYAPGASIYWSSAWTLIGNVTPGSNGGTGTPSNSKPVISGNPASIIEVGGRFKFIPIASDADTQDRLTFRIKNKPRWARFSSKTGKLRGRPRRASITNNIIISVNDGTDSVKLPSFSLTVKAAQAPVITLNGSHTITQQVGTVFTDLGATAIDNVDGNLTSSITVKGTVNTQVAGIYTLRYRVKDRARHTGKAVRTVKIENKAPPPPPPLNSKPVISGNPVTSIEADGNYTFIPVASDTDANDTLTFSVSNKPSWTSFNTKTGVITGKPSSASITNNIVISVSDGTDSAKLQAFSLTVKAAQAPVITLNGSNTITQQVGATFTDPGATANDNMDGNLTTAITVSGSVNTQVASTYTLTYSVSDAAGHVAIAIRTVIIESSTPTTKIPQYKAGTAYKPADQVQNFGKIYQCKPFPYAPWCQQSYYEPGQSENWQAAWILIGNVPGGSNLKVTAYAVGTDYKSGDTVSNLGHIYRCKGFPTTPWCKLEAYAPGDSAHWRDAWEYVGADTVDVNSSNGQIAITLPMRPEVSISNANITVNGVNYSAKWGERTLLTTMKPGKYKVSAANSDFFIPLFKIPNNTYFDTSIDLAAGKVTEIDITYVDKSVYAKSTNETNCNQCHSVNSLDTEAYAEKFLFNETRDTLISAISRMRNGTSCVGGCPEIMADYLRNTVWESYRSKIVNRINNIGQLPNNKGKRLVRLLTGYEYLNTIKDTFGITLPENDFSIYVPGRHLLFPTIHDRTITDNLLAEYINKGSMEIEKQIDVKHFTKCASDDLVCIVEIVGQQLFHRPLTTIESNTYIDMGNNEGLPMALAAMTLSPNFLYRTEMGDQDLAGEYQLTQYEIATALAYGYTGHGPGDLLLDLAERDELNSLAVLAIQAKRLIQTERGKKHLSRFFEPMMEISDEKLKLKDGIVMPSVIKDMKAELQLFLADVIVNEPSGIEQLYTPEFTYLNTTLADHYGINTTGLSSTMSKVPTGVNQGGLLHLGIFHTSNSGTESTHLIRRARVVRENLLCKNLGTPIGKIPEKIIAPELASSKEFWTVVTGPNSGLCWDCHQYMNDMGFALDSFDIKGKYRTTETVKGMGSKAGMEAVFDLLTEGYFTSAGLSDVFFTNLRDLSDIIGSSSKSSECLSSRYLQFMRGYQLDLSDSAYLSNAYNSSGITKDLMVKQVLLPSFINRQ